MGQQVTNFGRFYSAFHKLTIHGEPDEAKRQFVLQYTAGRTDSLKEMTRKEYTDLCVAIEGMNGTRDELKRRRSIALKLMQELEIDTTDWAQINDFCRHPRIAGKAFGQLLSHSSNSRPSCSRMVQSCFLTSSGVSSIT